ncbi:MAG: ABC transporter permease [bacterium]|nr:ABC transporter permease [bacterium]
MRRRFWALAVRDLKLVVRNHHLTIVVAVAVLYSLLVRFLIPADPGVTLNLVVWDQTGARALAHWYGEAAPGPVLLVDTETAYAEALEPGNRIGVKVIGGHLPEAVELTFQGHESSRVRRVLEATLNAQVAAMLRGEYPRFPVTSLRPPGGGEQPPFNLSLVPVLVLFEAAMLGMLLAGVLLFAEKDEQTLRAYRVTPGGTVEYLLARCAAMGMLALVSAGLLTVLTIGPATNWAGILPVVFLGSLVFTLVAMVLANLFKNLGQFYLPSFLLMLALMLPVITYFQPGVSLPLLHLLPTHPLIYALREAYFPTGSPQVLSRAALQLLATFAVAFPLAVWTFRRQLVVKDV